jgi:hypothetical protein
MKYNIPEEFKPFMASVKRQCKTYGVELMLAPAKKIVLTDDFEQECSGYFDSDEKVLAVACGKPFIQWFEILIHEFSHMEQWKTDPRWDEWHDYTGHTWGWLAGEKIMNKSQLAKALDKMVEMERDCEMRAVDKIRKWELPIPINRYTKKANTYLYSYYMLPEIKRFPTGIYYDKKLVEMSPEGFKKSYRKVPADMAKHIVKYYSKK